MTSNYATAADLLAHAKRRYVDAPVCGHTVRLRSVTAGEYAKVERLLMASASVAKGTPEEKRAKALADANALLIRYCACDQNGEMLFSEAEAARLHEVDSRLSQALVSACMDHCGLSEADMEALAKNSATTPSEKPPSE